MGTVTTLPRGRPLTAADLAAMPDDGHRYELIDGTLVVTPAPSLRHQLVSSRLANLLDRHCPTGLLVLTAPTDVRLADDTLLQPDILVVARETFDREKQSLPAVLLAVEILSPSTRHVDLSLKRARYEVAGCPAYWVVDPDALELTAWELSGDAYREVGHVSGDAAFAATQPFPVEVVPTELVR
ncbi:Uma2 family endonuclease [Nocardioides euryhalodurans]|uniref:Uma2 family endonuclease n=1 Tax=Nocardioides euryhalodurans TaxID=2518370 RepID=A0A4P7GJS7_9ACTN|nr:Uma2 family endonuclease [Nocardioides euryhalodurans]QBR92270.1 Uma2 family endonuclease [Nocardioides euryhalodurans]